MGFYDDKPDLFDTEVKGGFYGKAGAAPQEEAERPRISFKWWEWLIITVEVGLVTYTILVVANIVPLF